MNGIMNIMNIGNREERTISDNGNPRFILAWPVAKDLANFPLILQ